MQIVVATWLIKTKSYVDWRQQFPFLPNYFKLDNKFSSLVFDQIKFAVKKYENYF